jgi:hypothetical protein
MNDDNTDKRNEPIGKTRIIATDKVVKIPIRAAGMVEAKRVPTTPIINTNITAYNKPTMPEITDDIRVNGTMRADLISLIFSTIISSNISV